MGEIRFFSLRLVALSLAFNTQADLYIRGVKERIIDRIPLLRWTFLPNINTHPVVLGFTLVMSTIGWRLMLLYLEYRNFL